MSPGVRMAPRDPANYLRKTISLKLGEGDFKGAIRLACSDDALAETSEDTYSALLAKHPPPHPSSVPPPAPDSSQIASICVTPEMVVSAIRSFPAGSSGGPDGLLPQHLKDLLNPPSGVTAPFLSALSSFVSHVLNGNTPTALRHVFFGARLVALTKRDGGVRPIAVGSTLRRLVAKVAVQLVSDDMTTILAPRQLGFGVKGGAEAAVHAARSYLNHLDSDSAMVKLDFRNAFNTVRRDRMLEATSVLLLICILLSILHTRNLPLFSGRVELYNLLKVYNRGTLWALYFSAFQYTVLHPPSYQSSVFAIWMT